MLLVDADRYLDSRVLVLLSAAARAVLLLLDLA